MFPEVLVCLFVCEQNYSGSHEHMDCNEVSYGEVQGGTVKN